MTKAVTLYPSAPKAVAVLVKLEGEIERVKTLKQLDRIINDARTIKFARRDVHEVKSKGGRVYVKAERWLGVQLANIEKAKGTRGQLVGPGIIGGSKGEPPMATLKEMTVDKKRSARAQKLAAMDDERVEEIMIELDAEDKDISPSTVLAAERKRAKEAKREAVFNAVFSVDGPFGTAVIDPPWKVEKIDRDVRPNQDAFDYPTMTAEEIAALLRKELIPKLEADCHVFLWTTHKWLPAALKIVEELGFRYVLTMVWHKVGGFQPVGLPQYNCEFAVYARRGSPIFVETTDFPCCFEGERREHSRKPDRFYEIVRRVTGGSRIDVFSREARDGFAQYGNEITKFTEAAE